MFELLGDWTRTCYCGEVTEAYEGQTVTVMGWLDNRRDLGNLIFLDLRDREGLVQGVLSPEFQQALEKGKSVRLEFVLAIRGEVVKRSPETINPSLRTGRVEIQVEELRILNPSPTPPFQIGDQRSASEDTRLRYRFLDLRRRRLQRNFRLRHEAAAAARSFLNREGFYDIETPYLTKSTPEGARDYLVPSRLYPGQFFALPQSPQIFKQILMSAGFDKYYQIVRCFRDEDLRADRQPEFTQIDIEMSFIQKETIFHLIEGLLAEVFAVAEVPVVRPFPRLTFQEAMDRFGVDRPDTRYGLELVDLADSFAETPFQVFRSILQQGGRIKGIPVPGKASYSRRQLDVLGEVVRRHGAAGLAWIKREAQGCRASLPKAVPEPQLEAAARAAALQVGDLLLIVAGAPRVVYDSLAALRSEIARNEDWIPKDRWDFLWVHEFPLFEQGAQGGPWLSMHHPFTAPRDEDFELLGTDPGSALSKAYDVVLNGCEIGGGSIRIHQENVQQKVFSILQVGEDEAQAKFGFLLEALRYGAPPHGGIALGLDRIAMLLAGEQSLREVIAFPKTARALDLMCGAPSPVDPRQLEELRLKVSD